MPSRFTAYRQVALLFLLVLGPGACSSEPPVPPPYVGHWESLYRGRGGESNGLVIRADSTVDRLNYWAFDFHYRVEGDSLRLMTRGIPTPFTPWDTVPRVFTNHVSFSGDTLVRADSQKSEWLVREGEPVSGAPPIQGTWRVVRSSVEGEDLGFERFLADSVLQVRVPANTKTGSYRAQFDPVDTLRPDSLTMYFPDDTSRCVLTWKADTLVLTRTFTNGEFSFGYVRAGDSAWYRVRQP